MNFPTLHIPTIITQLELIALNKHGTIKYAAKELGISERSLALHMKNANIVRKKYTKEFLIKPKQHAKINVKRFPLSNRSADQRNAIPIASLCFITQ